MPSPRRDGTPTEINVSQEYQVSAVRPESISVGHPVTQKETNISEITSGIDTQHLKQVMMMRKYGNHNPNLHPVTVSESMWVGMRIAVFSLTCHPSRPC